MPTIRDRSEKTHALTRRAQPLVSATDAAAMFDTNLLAPVTESEPCGLDLEYDPEFLALERSLESAYAERAVGPEGDTALPDWKSIAEQALALSARSRDLRVAVALTRAWLHLDGLRGLARGLGLVRGLLTQHWLGVHPRLGAQGDAAGLMRIAALRSLCDARSVVWVVRVVPLVRAPGMRGLCLRDLEQALAAKQSDASVDDMAHVDAEFRGCDLAALQSTYRAAVEARADVAAIEAVFADRPGAPALRLTDLASQLDAIDAALAPRLAAREAAQEEAEQPEHRPEPAAPRSMPRVPPPPPPPPPLGAARPAHTRAEVVRELDRLCAYFELHEPSSPIPILLSRAKRLAGMPFIDIVRELAPGGLAEITTLRGPTTTEES